MGEIPSLDPVEPICIRQLVQEGLVEYRLNPGAVVRLMSLADLLESARLIAEQLADTPSIEAPMDGVSG
jgi:hypothetical protein